jgi:DNA-binding cell septation regulator SpoVG
MLRNPGQAAVVVVAVRRGHLIVVGVEAEAGVEAGLFISVPKRWQTMGRFRQMAVRVALAARATTVQAMQVVGAVVGADQAVSCFWSTQLWPLGRLRQPPAAQAATGQGMERVRTVERWPRRPMERQG